MKYAESFSEVICPYSEASLKRLCFICVCTLIFPLTDHRGLESLVAGKQCNRRVQGWALKMSEFSFSITYRKGSENIVADALSRCHEDVGDGESEHLFQEGGDVGVEREPLPHETLEREDSS